MVIGYVQGVGFTLTISFLKIIVYFLNARHVIDCGDKMMNKSLTSSLSQGILSQWREQCKNYNMKEKDIDKMLRNTMREQ